MHPRSLANLFLYILNQNQFKVSLFKPSLEALNRLMRGFAYIEILISTPAPSRWLGWLGVCTRPAGYPTRAGATSLPRGSSTYIYSSGNDVRP
jgi:hypothetical protein